MKRARRDDSNIVLSASKKTKHLQEHSLNQQGSPARPCKGSKHVLSPTKESSSSSSSSDEKDSNVTKDLSSLGMAEFLKLDIVTSSKSGRVKLRQPKEDITKVSFPETKENIPDDTEGSVSVRDMRERFTPSKSRGESRGRPHSYNEGPATKRGSNLVRGRGIARGTPVAKEQLRTPKRVASCMDAEDSFETPTMSQKLSFGEELRELNVNIKALTEKYDVEQKSNLSETKTPGRHLTKSQPPCKDLDVIATPGQFAKRSDARPARRRSRSCFTPTAVNLGDEEGVQKKTKTGSSRISEHDINPEEIEIDFKNLKGLFEGKTSKPKLAKDGEAANIGTKMGRKFVFDPVSFEIKESEPKAEETLENCVHEATGVLLRKPPLPRNRSISETITSDVPSSTKSHADRVMSAATHITPKQKQIQDKLEKIKEKLDFVRKSCEIPFDSDEVSQLTPHVDTPRPPRPTAIQFIDAGTPSVSFKVKAFTEMSEVKPEKADIPSTSSHAVKRKSTDLHNAGDRKGPLIKQLTDKYDKHGCLYSKHEAHNTNAGLKQTDQNIIDTHMLSTDPKVENASCEVDRNQVQTTGLLTNSGLINDNKNGKSVPAVEDMVLSSPVEKRKRRFETNLFGFGNVNKTASATSPVARKEVKTSTINDDITDNVNKPSANSDSHEIEEIKQLDNILNEIGSAISHNSENVNQSNEDNYQQWLDSAVESNLNVGRRPGEFGLTDKHNVNPADVSLSMEYNANLNDSSGSLGDLLEQNMIRYHTQPVDGQQNSEDDRSHTKATPGHARHHTQPVTPTEKEAAKVATESPPRSSNSIAERLASLQKSGDEAWKRRIGKRDTASPGSDSEPYRIREPRSALLSKENSPEPVQLRNRASELRGERPHSIADRLSLLGNAQDSWRNRVEEKDMSKFTVEGKLSSTGKMADSPIVRKGVHKKNALNRVTTNGESPIAHQSPLVARKTKTNRSTMPPMMQDITLNSSKQAASTPNIPASFSIVQDAGQTSSDSEKEVDKTKSNKVVVPRLDDETFQAFYEQKDSRDILRRNKVKVSVDDFDHVFMESEDILISTRKTRPQNRKQRASRNPVKALAQRGDVQEEYIEEIHGVAEREMKRIKTEQIAGKACIATEALAGLASKESFDKTKLRKAESFSGLSPGSDKFLPYSDLMLLQVKGRRTCQTRLVKPCAPSINSGDAFVLVLPDKVYVWLGEFCNIIEKAKALDVASTIQQKKDMGCKSLFDPITVYESKSLGSSAKEFWKAIGGFQKYQDPGPNEEDELYEMYINETNIVYRVKDDKLIPVKDYWGHLLKHEMLNSKDMYVFDFGSEVYLWTGKQVPFASRKNGLKLLEEIWKKGYDYTNCDINPLSPLQTAENGGSPSKSNKRPEWALLGKVNQNMETILFREKFIDWPDSAKLIKAKDTNEKETKAEVQAELVPCDVNVMLNGDPSPVDLILEGSHVGRGDQWIDTEDGIRRVFEVKTLDISVWHVLEYEHYILDEISVGQFHEGDTYVIKWHYMITQAGIKSLKGNETRNVTTGREKCAYFFWQGRHSSINEKGASALMTVELDEERGPQVRVVQGKEPPAFIQLFNGRMVTHIGKREDETTNTQGSWRLFLTRNELPNECYLQEVTPCVQNLRSRSSCVLVNVSSGQVYVWHGAKSSSQTRKAAESCADHIKWRKPPEIGFSKSAKVSITQIEEGEEKTEFWKGLDAVSRRQRTKYHSLQAEAKKYEHSVRIFHMCSVSGTFEATEVLNPARGPHPSPFTALQNDLQRVPQPGLFLVDNEHTVYLWQGAWPEETAEDENVTTGSAQSRFNANRICAMQTCLDYCKAKKSSRPPEALLVYGGVEPLEFQNLFPLWEVDEKAKQKQLEDGHEEGQTVSVKVFLHKLTQTKYTWEELQRRPLPEGVDPSKMEKFLKESEFEKGLGMSQAEFYELPQWKQTNIKREKGLF